MGKSLSCRWYLNDLIRVTTQMILAQTGKPKEEYFIMKHGGNGSAKVLFARTACNYGGYRIWFVCPECNRRTSALYIGLGRYACRRCWRLPYQSQSRGKVDRLLDRAEEIESMIEGEYGEKPKGMHWKTYERLQWEARDLRDRAFIIGARALLGL